jgi:hypothetical protein
MCLPVIVGVEHLTSIEYGQRSAPGQVKEVSEVVKTKEKARDYNDDEQD